MLTTKLVTADEELVQVAALCQENLSVNISAETKAKEGFVSWVYTANILRALHTIAPSVIVKDGEVVAGYALTLTPASRVVYPHMENTLHHISALEYKGRPISTYRFYLMGQICVRKAYRGQGVVDLLYEGHRKFYSTQYDLLVTEISSANPRSMKAHQRAGFQVIDTYLGNGEEWDVVLLDFSNL